VSGGGEGGDGWHRATCLRFLSWAAGFDVHAIPLILLHRLMTILVIGGLKGDERAGMMPSMWWSIAGQGYPNGCDSVPPGLL
jgi:hypothetical protein